ncbi:hypothetical protein EYF80_022806 [Liparis tanakae]|uniref:Uncharacterized protein n=1 Tax=Liparis tanakae TaxID=230148 RepID=A0A4Z2HPW5_9TELE|nr:hypothetical protein EYF80_022806 [Liparis tanakae]
MHKARLTMASGVGSEHHDNRHPTTDTTAAYNCCAGKETLRDGLSSSTLLWTPSEMTALQSLCVLLQHSSGWLSPSASSLACFVFISRPAALSATP